ncbi:hypothetical protein G3142_005452 [Salmonella enterica subsp. enterica serovar Montevideo]|nr:hypothetical protein [Salmonella enterica subsp. enterica serovar Montevideo]EEK7813088.1 hypothetical protein [Salmonella enterica subsp. enterica serovar Montevideo]
MKLKNIALSTAMAAVMMSGVAQAADSGQVSFMGAVTAKTCDIETSVNGAVTDLVQLGTVVAGSGDAGKSEKEFTLKIKDAATCDVTATPAAFVSWNGSSLNSQGLANSNGTAADAEIKLTAVNSKTPNTAVNSTKNEVEFVAADVKTAGGFKFKATLIPGSDKGSVDTSAAFAVRYQ